MRTAKTLWINCFNWALDWIYPAQCALCTRIGAPPVCEVCASEMTPIIPLEEETQDKVLSFRLSAYNYDGRASQAVRGLKYSRATSLTGFMSQAISKLGHDAEVVSERVIVPVPIHWSRRCTRGFNQAELLCERLPQNQVKKDVLIRAKATAPQASLNAEQRRTNLVGAFKVRADVVGKRVLLVDDVVTTGHTARECARVLMEAGAIDVGLITFAAEL